MHIHCPASTRFLHRYTMLIVSCRWICWWDINRFQYARTIGQIRRSLHIKGCVFNVMPFGLCNAPATFQRLMDAIFREKIGKDLAASLDDLLMYALRHIEMLPIFSRTLGELIDAGLKCKPRKCQVFPESISTWDTSSRKGKSQRIGVNSTRSVNGPFQSCYFRQ